MPSRTPCGCLKDTEGNLYMAANFGRARQQPDGSILYVKRGPEPPPDLDGYKRDPRNFWRFTPLWMQCDYRLQNQYLKACGAIGILSICQNPDGPRENQREVDFNVCSACQLCKQKP